MIHYETPNEEAGSREGAISLLAHVRLPPFSHLFMQKQARTSKEPSESINAHNARAP